MVSGGDLQFIETYAAKFSERFGANAWSMIQEVLNKRFAVLTVFPLHLLSHLSRPFPLLFVSCCLFALLSFPFSPILACWHARACRSLFTSEGVPARHDVIPVLLCDMCCTHPLHRSDLPRSDRNDLLKRAEAALPAHPAQDERKDVCNACLFATAWNRDLVLLI